MTSSGSCAQPPNPALERSAQLGKRGGLRVIYFVRFNPNEFWMLAIYAKAKLDNVPGHILKDLLEAFRNG
jgi:hypothetical protein